MQRQRGMIRPDDMMKLRENRARQAPVQGSRNELDLEPAVRLYVPFTALSWLLTEVDDEGYGFGLCDLGQGFPELGSVSLPEFEEINIKGLTVLQDLDFKPRTTISRYAREASANQQITL